MKDDGAFELPSLQKSRMRQGRTPARGAPSGCIFRAFIIFPFCARFSEVHEKSPPALGTDLTFPEFKDISLQHFIVSAGIKSECISETRNTESEADAVVTITTITIMKVIVAIMTTTITATTSGEATIGEDEAAGHDAANRSIC